jgi:uncharacterized membrane protein YozB (DUF420 family)
MYILKHILLGMINIMIALYVMWKAWKKIGVLVSITIKGSHGNVSNQSNS